MFVSQDHFLIQCKAVAQATFIFAFSNFECSIQQSLFFQKKKKGTVVRKKCGPGLGGFLGVVDSWRGTKFSVKVPVFPPCAIIVLAVHCSSPSSSEGTRRAAARHVSPNAHRHGEHSPTLKTSSSPSPNTRSASNRNNGTAVSAPGVILRLSARAGPELRRVQSEICFWLSRHSVSYCSTLASN